MLDGVDGLVGTVALCQLALILFLSYQSGILLDTQVIWILIAAILGYLWFNFPLPGRKHAKVFMGDAGSMFLGFALVWFSIYLSQPPHRVASPTTFLWILIVPLFDITGVICRRLLHKKSPIRPDREHIHHLLEALGFSKFWTVIFLGLITLIFGGLAIAAYHYKINAGIVFLVFLLLFIGYFFLSNLIWKKLKK
jgi:UDP-GlcNAc:undecaprenyl-phosphate GlcNAc-1-phosphate transferase